MKKRLFLKLLFGLIIIVILNSCAHKLKNESQIVPKICGDGFCEVSEKESCLQDCPNKCLDECYAINSKECSENGYRLCGNSDSDSCLEFSTINSCPENTKCINGAYMVHRRIYI